MGVVTLSMLKINFLYSFFFYHKFTSIFSLFGAKRLEKIRRHTHTFRPKPPPTTKKICRKMAKVVPQILNLPLSPRFSCNSDISWAQYGVEGLSNSKEVDKFRISLNSGQYFHEKSSELESSSSRGGAWS